MLHYCDGDDIFKSPAQTLVNPVNTMGVMGNGLALQFKRRFPKMFQAYQKACQQQVFKRFGLFVWTESENRKILCFPTKVMWRFNSKIEWIDVGLERLAKDYKKYGITSIAIPAIGCGKGKLDWVDVERLIVAYLSNLDIDVYVYPPILIP